MNFDNHKFRCSSLGHLMVEPRSKTELISETTKTHLMDVYVSSVFNRRSDITSKFLEKGTLVEDESIDLLSSVDKEFYIKNETHFSNDYIMGTPDIIHENDGVKLIIDIKSSWDIYTFSRSFNKENKMYYWQVLGYMELLGAKTAKVVYCLVDTPDFMIDRELKKALYQSGIDENSKEFIEYAAEMREYYKYSDIPKAKRVFPKDYVFNSEHLDQLYSRIQDCRQYLNTINW